MKVHKLLIALAAGASLELSAATIVWDEAQNVAADADVSTEGDLVCAYNENNVDATINGVLFKGYVSSGLLPLEADEPDLQLANFGTGAGEARANTFLKNFVSSDTLSADYANLLAGAAFNRNACSTATVTLLGLQPGEEYLVQVWMNDNRSTSDRRSTVIDGVCQVEHYSTSGSYGQWAVGRFRADSTNQVISLYSDLSPQLNAIQVRRLSSIVWGEPQIIGDGSEVNNSGSTLYAYHFARDGSSQVVNGVTFKDFGINGANARANVSLTAVGPSCELRTVGGAMGQKTVWPDGTPDSYTNILKYALYVNSSIGSAWLDITLKSLVPGKKYAVQFWHLDARYNSATCTIYQKIDGVRSLYAYNSAEGYAGQTVTGTFIATSTNKTIRVRGYNVSPSWHNNPLVNAFQVRDVTDVGEFSTVSLSSDSAVRTDGELVYAYTASDANLTVNGVAFTSQYSPSSWDSGNVQFTGFTSRTPTAFHTDRSTDFYKLLAAGVYARASEVNNQNPAPATLVFNGLEPSKPHLIQVFVNDSRSGTEDRVVKFCDQAQYVRYQNSGIFIVRPNTSSYTLSLLFTADLPDNISPQVNAVQVRRLPDMSASALTWNGGSTGEWTTGASGWTGSGELPATPWSAENGVERDAVVGDGTTLAVGAGVTARNLVAQGALTLNGLPTLTGEIMGGDVTIASPWMDWKIEKTASGRLTLGPCPTLRRVVVTQGTLVFGAESGVVSPTEFYVFSPGKAEIVAGATVAVEGETFDLSSISAIRALNGIVPRAPVLTTTGSFTGELPPVIPSASGLRLKVESVPGGGEALMLSCTGMSIIFR